MKSLVDFVVAQAQYPSGCTIRYVADEKMAGPVGFRFTPGSSKFGISSPSIESEKWFGTSTLVARESFHEDGGSNGPGNSDRNGAVGEVCFRRFLLLFFLSA